MLLCTVPLQLTEDVIVQCYPSAADCTSNTNGVILAAIDCCNRTGGGYISHSSATRQCGACVGKDRIFILYSLFTSCWF